MVIDRATRLTVAIERRVATVFARTTLIPWELSEVQSAALQDGPRQQMKTSRWRMFSKETEAHWLHDNDLEDDEAAFDGRPILLVTQPAIVAIGKSDGSDYSSRRNLKKAIVWMG